MTKPKREGGFSGGTKLNYGKALGIMRTHQSPAGLFASILLADLDEQSVELYLAEIARQRGTACAGMQRALVTNLWEFAKGYPEFKRRGKACPTLGIKKMHKVMRGLTMHGLRATVAAQDRIDRAGVEGAKAVGGWKSDKLARKYAAEHDRRRVSSASCLIV